ncbi:Urb2/Npa2 family-domain-containing protein [Dichotomocladium elegans]|nr:Urb2/Npa2 family-domain-containing protein [Dichotomocladium elegans]
MSSEQIAKALKGAGLSPKERIATAIDAWQNTSILFPNKDDFLLEWLCVALVKSKSKTSTEAVVTQIAYWDLLLQLLAHYVRRADERRRSPPTIRVQLINALGALLQSIGDTELKEESNALLDKATGSFELLFSSTFSLSYRPPLEQTTFVVEQLLGLLEAHTENSSLARLAVVLLTRYYLQINQSPNQKKIFATILGKPFPAMLSIRRRIASTGSLGQQVADKLTDILTLVLYHPDTIMEFKTLFRTTTAVEQGATSMTFVYKLFEEMSALLKTEETIQDDMLPVLYSRYITAFRKKRGNASGQDADRIAEFGFLVECHAMLERNLKPAVYIDTLCKLLKIMADMNVIVSRNDDISRSQYGFLETISDNAVALLQNNDGVPQDSVMRLLDVLLHIDLTLIESRTDSIWPFLVEPSSDSVDACQELALSILRVYSATRQLDAFLKDMASSFQRHAPRDLYTALSMPLFSNKFLDEFSQLVAKTSTAAQSIIIFDFFANEMYASLDSSTVPSCPSSRLLSVFFARFIDAVKLSQHQRHTFEQHSRILLDRYIRPGLEKLEDLEGCVLPAMQIHSALTNSMTDVYWITMQDDVRESIIQALCRIFEQNIKAESTAARCAVILSATAILQHAYFVSLNSGLPDISAPALNLVKMILDFVLDDKEPLGAAATWDGSLLHLDNGAVKLACWKLLTDDWFDIICRCQASDTDKQLASLVLLPALESPLETTQSSVISLCTISHRLLCTASLYETLFFREHAVNIIVDIFAKFFQRFTEHTAEGRLAALFHDEDKRYSPWEENEVNELAKLLDDTLSNDHHGDEELSEDAVRVLKLALLFPSEYYRKQHRTVLIKASLLMDGYSYIRHGKGTQVSLLSRTLFLRCIAASGGHYALKLNDDILAWQLDSAALTEPSVGADLLDITHTIDKHLLRILLGSADNDPYADAILRVTFKKRVEWLTSGRENSVGWIVNVVESITNYLKAHPTRRSEYDPKSIVYAADSIREISHHVIKSLAEGQAILVDDPRNALAILTKHLLTLTSLLQEYAMLLNANTEQPVDEASLSRGVLRLASPIATLIQRLPLDHTIRDQLLSTTTAFIPSLCKAVERYHNTDPTERVFAMIWFIVVRLYESEKKSVNAICAALSSWIKTMNPDQYNAILSGFVAQAGQVSQEGKELVFITLLSASVGSGHYIVLKRHLSALTQILANIGQTTKSVEFTRQSLALLADITADNLMVIPNSTLSKIMGCVVQLTNYSAPIDKESSGALVGTICSILQNMLRYHREDLVDVLPSFTALIQAVLRCFRSTHLVLTSKTHKERPYTYMLLAPSSPLDVPTAEKLARVFESMPARIAVEGRNRRLSQQVQNQLISKQAPFILLEYFTIQAHPAKNIAQVQVRAVLEQGLYCVMDMVDEKQRHFVLASLNEAGKVLFKNFYNSWKENHQYKGQ